MVLTLPMGFHLMYGPKFFADASCIMLKVQVGYKFIKLIRTLINMKFKNHFKIALSEVDEYQ